MADKILNEQQIEAIQHGTGPILIIAGAGTGKTTVITERIKYLITKEFAKPGEILALTFTEKASREMEERVDIAMPYGYTQMWISTFHSFCDRVLRLEALHIGLNPGYKLMTEAESILFFKKNLFKFDLEYFRPLGNPTKFIVGILQHFARLHDEDISPEQYLEWIKKAPRHSGEERSDDSRIKNITDSGQARMTEYNNENLLKYRELASAYQRYEELKIKEGLMDFADLIGNALKIFRTRKNVLSQYQKQFKYILVDEYQDTNIAQNELVKLLAGSKPNLTVVADDDQSVYRFRSAAVSNVIQFRNTYPKVKIVTLTKNYRSTQEILDRSYDLIQNNNPDRLEVKEKINKKLISERRIKGEKIEFIHADRVENEADFIAKKIKELTENKKYNFSDFAVLVRANSHADPVTKSLSRFGIPYQFLGPGMLFKQPEVKDIIAYLKVLYNFEDNVSMYRLLTMDLWEIPARDIAAVINNSRKLNISLFEACEKICNENNNYHDIYYDSKTSEKIKKIVDMINRHLKLVPKESAGQICYFFLEDSGLLAKLAEYKSAKDEKIAQNISKFFDKLKTFEVGHEDAKIFPVVDWIDLSMELGESPLAADNDWSSNNAVNILTIHSAKGLEFPVVFLINLVSQRFPTTEKKEPIPIPTDLIKEILPEGDSHLEEERRLFYVGLTRARDLLYLTAADYYGEGKREKKISPFVEETIGESASKIKADSQKSAQLSLLEWKKIDQIPVVKTKIPINFLSYSQLDTFKTCPLQYKYKYILRIPVPPKAAAVFGDIMHKTLFSLYHELKNGKILKESELFAVFENLWTPIGFSSKNHEEKMKIKGKNALALYYDGTFNPKSKALALEQKFSFPISPSLKLGGKIDRVDDLGGGRIEIIDYKTGRVPTKKEIDANLQISIYALAGGSKWIFQKDPKNILLSFYFFETREKISTSRTQGNLDKVKENILEKAGEMEKSDFLPTPGLHCNFCDFKMICEAWK